jgi:hypothetical protein
LGFFINQQNHKYQRKNLVLVNKFMYNIYITKKRRVLLMDFSDIEEVVFYSIDDEEPYEKSFYPTDISEISHLYWDDEWIDGQETCFCMGRRSSQEDYWQENAPVSLSVTPLAELQTRHALVQLGPRIWVPARNISNVWSEKGKTMVDIGDLHPERSKRSVADVLGDCRRELQRVYSRPAPDSEFERQDGLLLMSPQELRAAINRIDGLLVNCGATPFLPGF